MSNITKHLSQVRWDLNPGLHEYEASVNTDHVPATIGIYDMHSYVDDRPSFE
jgi:hypothetical protein